MDVKDIDLERLTLRVVEGKVDRMHCFTYLNRRLPPCEIINMSEQTSNWMVGVLYSIQIMARLDRREKSPVSRGFLITSDFWHGFINSL